MQERIFSCAYKCTANTGNVSSKYQFSTTLYANDSCENVSSKLDMTKFRYTVTGYIFYTAVAIILCIIYHKLNSNVVNDILDGYKHAAKHAKGNSV